MFFIYVEREISTPRTAKGRVYDAKEDLFQLLQAWKQEAVVQKVGEIMQDENSSGHLDLFLLRPERGFIHFMK